MKGCAEIKQHVQAVVMRHAAYICLFSDFSGMLESVAFHDHIQVDLYHLVFSKCVPSPQHRVSNQDAVTGLVGYICHIVEVDVG